MPACSYSCGTANAVVQGPTARHAKGIGQVLPPGLPRARPGAGDPAAPTEAAPAGDITRTGSTGQLAAPAVPGPQSCAGPGRRKAPALAGACTPGRRQGNNGLVAAAGKLKCTPVMSSDTCHRWRASSGSWLRSLDRTGAGEHCSPDRGPM